MKFGSRECANIVFRAKQETKIGSETFHVGQPVLYIDTATATSIEQASTTVYAQGGRGNARLMAWEGEKTMTFTVTDALLSPIGLSILIGAGLFKGSSTATNKVHYHMTSMAEVEAASDSESNTTWYIDLFPALYEFGKTSANKLVAEICTTDAPIYILGTEEDGSITGKVYRGTITAGTSTNQGVTGDKAKLTIADCEDLKGVPSVMVDYYIDLPYKQVYELDITPEDFAGYYYVEADTLFRRQHDGVDMPANITFPNVKIQSNMTLSLSSTGDPSTFDFTMDAFPGYTYFDKTKKVLCVIQFVDDTIGGQVGANNKPVMPHDEAGDDINSNKTNITSLHKEDQEMYPYDSNTDVVAYPSN